MNDRQNEYLQRVDQAILYAIVFAVLVAGVVGLFLTGPLTRSLKHLLDAIHGIQRGQLQQNIPVTSRDELGQVATAFNMMSQQLDQANTLRRQMTANIAHDLRTPLTVMAGYIEAIRDGVLSATKERLQAMYDESQYLLRLVQDLHTLSLADAGELPIHLQSVAPADLLNSAARTFEYSALQHQVTLRVECPDLMPIQVDRERVLQVIGNLLSNALRYTPPGGNVLLCGESRSDGVQLMVADNGAGISAEHLPYIFERLYRADQARNQVQGESGLGLAIARSLIEAHGGTIRAVSQVGAGTRMIIYLPYVQTKKAS